MLAEKEVVDLLDFRLLCKILDLLNERHDLVDVLSGSVKRRLLNNADDRLLELTASRVPAALAEIPY